MVASVAATPPGSELPLVLRRYSEHSRVNFTFESEAELLISPSPAVTLGFHGMRNVTAKSSCCQPSALFMSVETPDSAHFGALRRNVVAVHFKDCFAAEV